ncbi:3-hydroxyacyl-CoA dehydrogenase [Thiolinea disciformis]|uniref:3-hydroxyacyl-CoA dehydrogenase n=1 Tax=Thiolinea disciformis TaxID=125614 RepID=UPI000370E220|nr:3-hydroxyacyl-CoA dehydrogenase [Thiolinea disciformis]
MTTPSLTAVPVLIIGTGIMGAGIAQVSVQAGHTVLLYDAREGAATEAKAKLGQTFTMLVDKGKLSADKASAMLDKVQAIHDLSEAKTAGLAIEAIVENLAVKRSLFQQLEGIVSPECVLATNTSSISVTAIANGLKHPERLVGMHFFNPVPLMKLVEVVSGLQTQKAIAEAIFELSQSWGKTPVYARSTPGFIVNRIARPFYAETLALLHEHALRPVVADACLRAVGFRMGPCELMDLIGHDTNFSVTRSVYEANFYDKRYVPSLVQAELVDGGLLGRKTGQGFYDYRETALKPSIAEYVAAPMPTAQDVTVMGQGRVADLLARRLKDLQINFTQLEDADWIGIDLDGAQLRLTDGRTATQLGKQVAVFDLPLSDAPASALAWAISGRANREWQDKAQQCLQALGFNAQQVADTPGLLVARTIAMLINEAADAVQQQVCTPEGADAAMKLGVNYPAGPFEWLAQWDSQSVVRLLNALDQHYRGERYRVSPWLVQQQYLHGLME